MPRGPQGQIRPADAVGCAITVGRIAGYRQKGSGSTLEIDMAALKMSFRSLWKSSKRGNLDVDSNRAREFVRRTYNESGGPTPELKRVYETYLENERKRSCSREKHKI
jgi:hypothetical protein